MSFKFSETYPTGVTTTSPFAKDLVVKVAKLVAADFVTGGTASVKIAIPADASITAIKYWKKTAFSGGSVSAVTLSIGVTGTATKYASAFDVHTPAAGTQGFITPVTNILQEYDPTAPNSDQALLFTGTATTGNPTAGELYVLVEYVR